MLSRCCFSRTVEGLWLILITPECLLLFCCNMDLLWLWKSDRRVGLQGGYLCSYSSYGMRGKLKTLLSSSL
uniref:Uncharacterized protein n=1 Tax=Physcomitrium patens TaxID=3218 RepID=A0A2K1K3N0_PHYPA|nr:hypothetical protein PHYPA_012855 [Physcomitrium patens]